MQEPAPLKATATQPRPTIIPHRASRFGLHPLTAIILALPLVCQAQPYGPSFYELYRGCYGTSTAFDQMSNFGTFLSSQSSSGSWGAVTATQNTSATDSEIRGTLYVHFQTSSSTNNPSAFADSWVSGYFYSTNDTPFFLSGVASAASPQPNYAAGGGVLDGIFGPAGSGFYVPVPQPIHTSPDPHSVVYQSSGVFLARQTYSFQITAGGFTIESPNGEVIWQVDFILSILPAFSTSLAPTGLNISWPAVFTNFVLETSTTIGPGASWTPATNTVTTQTDQSSISVATTNAPSQFFRMRHT